MSAFYSLGNVQQATLAMVAPGISEALVTTAFGLFAAIPGGRCLQPLRRPGEPAGDALRRLHGRVFHHPAAPCGRAAAHAAATA